MSNLFSCLSNNLFVHQGAINVGILRDGHRALLVDFGDGSVRAALDELHIRDAEYVLFTHHHRDQASGIGQLANGKVGVPEQERAWFEEAEKFWDNPETRWHLYNIHPHNLMLAESLPTGKFEIRALKEGDSIEWGNSRISVLDTPGHTDGSLSYLVEVDGELFAFCGDVIYDKGQLWELYSLQKGGTMVSDYHGFLGSREQLKESLLKLRAAEPKALIPSHGNIIYEPADAIDALIERLDECYDKYVAISALRYYFPDMFSEFKGRDEHMPIRSGKPVPEFLRHYGTTWLIISQTGEAFAMDCGGPNVVKQVRDLRESGEISGVAGLWITHYHDDHVDAIPQFQDAFRCPIYADTSVAQVVENPRGFRTPCISPVAVQVDHKTEDGESWTWNEFRMTAYHFPGQTYYHGGLLVEGRGVRMFFAGDSFTMSGIDDYCSGNRNWLGEDVGFDRCLKLMQDLKPTHIFNCHVDKAFDFTHEELLFMRANLAEREQLYGSLFPWDSPNYGMDEYWVMCYPYEQDAAIEKTVDLRVDITNHSPSQSLAVCRPILPSSWGIEVNSKSVSIPAKSEGQISFSFAISEDAAAGRVIIPVDVTYNDRPLGQFREAVLVVKSEIKNSYR
jgi:glyoxylase-like metal-dependent hydrolase (beta-lactamase superfamily II)